MVIFSYIHVLALSNYIHVHFILAYAIEIKGGNFSYLPKKPKVLHHINLALKEGSLTALVGSVGAGKSSLLGALIGELYKHSGTVTLKVIYS